MTPFEQAESTALNLGDTFYADLAEHLTHGIVVSTPTAFVMGRAVSLENRDNVLDLSYHFLPGECDAWFVWLAAGDMREFFRACPYPLPHISYQRSGELRIHDWDRMNRLITGNS